MSDATWYSAHIFYYDDQDGLLLDCIGPLIEHIAPAAERVYFVRHWRQGPHVRLCMAAEHTAFHDDIRPQIDAAASRYLAAHPSRARIDEPRLLAIHRTLAAREKERGPLTPLQPDNSIRHEPHDRRLDVLGHEAAAALPSTRFAPAICAPSSRPACSARCSTSITPACASIPSATTSAASPYTVIAGTASRTWKPASPCSDSISPPPPSACAATPTSATTWS